MTQPKTIEGREYTKFVDSPTRSNSSAAESVITNNVNVINISQFGSFDKIEVTYPTSIREVYTYSLNNDAIGSVIVDYEDTSKKILSMVTYDAI